MRAEETAKGQEEQWQDEDSVQQKEEKNIWLHKLQNIKLSKEKREKIAILFLLGVFFLLIATPISSLNGTGENRALKKEKEETVTEQTIELHEKDEYIESLENKLEQTIGGMEGAGKVLVMITLKDSGEKILDKNQPYENSSEVRKEEGAEIQQSSIKSNQETVLVEEDGNTGPIVVQELYPDIEGVVVVCEGGDNVELSLRIKEAVQALFSIDAHKIVVCKLQQ